jgi:Na+/proline symporter
MNVIAGVWLLPVGVVIYTLTGGIKATILTDYFHTIVIYAMVLAGLFVVYTSSTTLGSPDRVYDLLREQAKITPVAGNAGGEYLTMRSQSGVLLGVVFWCAVFGTTIDVQLFQKAITADPVSTLPGYMIGGLAWFSIPFCLATTFGLAARAMQGMSQMHTLTADDISHGLALPYAAQALMGKGGSFFVLLMTFMACTSGFSADIVSIAAVYTYDIYGGKTNFQNITYPKHLIHDL